MDLGHEKRGKPPFIKMPEMYVWWKQAGLRQKSLGLRGEQNVLGLPKDLEAKVVIQQ